MARAKVVKIDAASELAQGVDIAGDHIVCSRGDDGFQHFDREPVGGQVEPVQLPSDFVDEPGVGKFTPGEIHPDLRHHGAGPIPSFEGGEGVVHHDFGQTLQQAGLFDGGQEIRRGDHALYRMVPARQGFKAGDLACVG